MAGQVAWSTAQRPRTRICRSWWQRSSNTSGPRLARSFVDCTLGGGGHARALLARLLPAGRLIGLDVDPLELPATTARLTAAGFGPDAFVAYHRNFRDLPDVLGTEGLSGVDGILLDLGVSSMQHDTPARGFSYKHPGPLDLRMDPTRGAPASDHLASLDEPAIEALLTAHADEPHAALIARWLHEAVPRTTHALERTVRLGLAAAFPALPKADVKMSVRRTFQALRILVNDELTALDDVLAALPACLSPGGRVVVLTFHSGEDRRVKHAFRDGYRAGVYVGHRRHGGPLGEGRDVRESSRLIGQAAVGSAVRRVTRLDPFASRLRCAEQPALTVLTIVSSPSTRRSARQAGRRCSPDRATGTPAGSPPRPRAARTSPAATC